MSGHYLPEGYRPVLSTMDTQQAIPLLKTTFQNLLGDRLNLLRISAPLFVSKSSGLNDDLSGRERKVSFDTKEMPDVELEVVQSLAKWKRFALGRYGYQPGFGIYTDMNAIRRDEESDNLHSFYVDQWDWEKVITPAERNLQTLYNTVRIIHACIRDTAQALNARFTALQAEIPQEITIISAEELQQRYPQYTPAQREQLIAKECGAVFIAGIGKPLADGIAHDLRAPDYDDWLLNGDILYYCPMLERAVEISSMGIRVDADTLQSQLIMADCLWRKELPFHRALYAGELPQTIGGGIGQSRLSMLLLKKAHIGEVQCSVWPPEVVQAFAQAGVLLL